jgi:hypothetical protein
LYWVVFLKVPNDKLGQRFAAKCRSIAWMHSVSRQANQIRQC